MGEIATNLTLAKMATRAKASVNLTLVDIENKI